jgi:hypothetical protein
VHPGTLRSICGPLCFAPIFYAASAIAHSAFRDLPRLSVVGSRGGARTCTDVFIANAKSCEPRNASRLIRLDLA